MKKYQIIVQSFLILIIGCENSTSGITGSENVDVIEHVNFSNIEKSLTENSLIVATQGRSLWILDDLTVLHQIDKNTINQPINLFKPKDSYRTQGSSTKKTSLTQGANLPNGVIVHFNLKDFDDAKLLPSSIKLESLI